LVFNKANQTCRISILKTIKHCLKKSKTKINGETYHMFMDCKTQHSKDVNCLMSSKKCFLAVVGFALGLYHLSHTSSVFLLWYFGDRVLLFAQVSLDHDPPILLIPLLLGWQACTTMPSFFLLRWCLTNFFCSSWSGTARYQSPAEIGMTGACYQAHLLVEMGVLHKFYLGWPRATVI
jgi:hypothetical protein